MERYVSEKNIRILGIDPGYATVGFGCIDCHEGKKEVLDFGVISTCKTLSFEERLKEIGEDFKKLLDIHKPDRVVIEELFFNKNVTTAMAVAHARGVILYLSTQAGLPTYHINPLQVKLALTGDGHADKKQVQKMIMHEFGLSAVPTPDDAADALAIALSFFFQKCLQTSKSL